MKYSELLIEQQKAIYPIFAAILLDKNLHGFTHQMQHLYLGAEKSKKGTKEELQAINQLFNCVCNIYGATLENDLQKAVNQFTSQIPIFVDLVCSKELQKASYTFEKCTDNLVWYNILSIKYSIYKNVVNSLEKKEQDLVQKKGSKKQLIAA